MQDCVYGAQEIVKKLKTGERIVFLSLFWFLACVANVNNCKAARSPLEGHREVRTTEKIARRNT